MVGWKVLLEAPFVSVACLNFVCSSSMLLSVLHPNCLLENKTMFYSVWFYLSHYHFVVISFTTMRGRQRLLRSFSKFQVKTYKNPANFVKMLPLIALILDMYKSWNDFNMFAIIALYLPGFYSADFIYATIEMLETAIDELQRLNKNKFSEKHYHSIYKAICDINTTFGQSLFNHVLLTTATGLFFSYTHCVDLIKIYKHQSIVPPATYAPDFFTVSTMIVTISLTRASHKLKMRSGDIKRVASELQLWQLNYEKMEVRAWDYFTIGNNVIISIAWAIIIYVLVLIQMEVEEV